MKLDEFIDENGISVFVKADIRTKRFEVIKTDIKHETYNLFQLILYNSVDNLFESVQMLKEKLKKLIYINK